MNRILTVVAVVAGLGVSIYVVGSWCLSSGSASETVLSEEINYLCRETGEIIRGPREPGPEGFTAGDRQTLVQALYCPQCQKWYPFPSPEALAHMPMGPRCPKDRAGLLEEIPETTNNTEVLP
jgi:hypothetical protein